MVAWLQRIGYESWRDVRNDIFLLTCLAKLGSLVYVVHDWYVFHNGGGSRVLGFIVTHWGWDSWLYSFVKSIWMAGR